MSIQEISDDVFELDSVTDIPTPTPFDKTLAVFISLPLSDRDRLQNAGRQLTKAHQEINSAETPIDQLGFYTYRTESEQIFVFNPTTPVIEGDILQSKLTQAQDQTKGFLPDRLAVVVDALNNHLPTWVKPKIGPWWLGAFGISPVVVCRLVMPGDGKLTRAQNLNTNALKDFITKYSDASYLYQAITRHRPNDLPPHYAYSVTVRIALFGSEHQVNTEAELAEVLSEGRPRNPTEVFQPLGVSSNWDAFGDHLYQDWRFEDHVKVSGASTIPRKKDVVDYATGTAEFDELRRERYVGADAYDHVCNYTQLMARETDLQQLFTLATPSPSPSPWRQTYGRNPTQATQLKEPSRSGQKSALELADKHSDPPSDIATKQRSSPNDGGKDHWQKIKTTARILREQGYDVHIVEQDSGSRPDLWIRDDDGQIYAVEVECSSPSKPANTLSNISRSALWGYPVIIVAADDSTADTITDIVAKPFSAIDGDRTRLYNRSHTVTVDGQQLVVAKDAGETEWWATPDHTRQLIIDGMVIAESPLDAPFDEPPYPLPRLRVDDNQYIVEDPDGEIRARYQTKDRFQQNYRKLSAAYLCVDLDYFQFIDSFRVLDETQLVEYYPLADWETPDNSARHEASHEDAFTTLTIDKDGHELDEPPVRELVRNWIAAQTQHGPPAPNVYGEYRQDYADRSRNDDRPGANRFYTDMDYRYPRGFVMPNQKGLDTTPTFPDEWDIDEEELLQEPLVPGLDSRVDTLDFDTK